MRATCNNIHLLFACKVDELHSVTAHTDCEVCILFLLWMFHTVNQFIYTKDIHIQVMCTTVEVTIHYTHECTDTLLIIVTKSIWANCLCIRDTIKRILVWKLSC